MGTLVHPISINVISETAKGKCMGCGGEFDFGVIKFDGVPILVQKWCPTCIEQRNESAKEDADAAADRERVAQWDKLCPVDYRKTDLKRLQREMREMNVAPKVVGTGLTMYVTQFCDHVMQFDLKERGVALVGRTGRGKTRLMWLLLRRWFFRGVRILTINGATFADEVAASYDDGSKAADEFLKRYIQVPILFWDDMDKLRITDRSETAAYRLLEERRANGRVLCFTANSTPEELSRRMTEQRGGPVLTRLLAMAEVIHV